MIIVSAAVGPALGKLGELEAAQALRNNMVVNKK